MTSGTPSTAVCEFESDACDACAESGQRCFRRSRDCYEVATTETVDPIYGNLPHNGPTHPPIERKTTLSVSAQAGDDVTEVSNSSQWMLGVLGALILTLLIFIVVAVLVLIPCLCHKIRRGKAASAGVSDNEVTGSRHSDAEMQRLSLVTQDRYVTLTDPVPGVSAASRVTVNTVGTGVGHVSMPHSVSTSTT